MRRGVVDNDVIGDVPEVVDVRDGEGILPRQERSEAVWPVSGGLVGETHAVGPPLDAEGVSVGATSPVAEGAEPDRQECP